MSTNRTMDRVWVGLHPPPLERPCRSPSTSFQFNRCSTQPEDRAPSLRSASLSRARVVSGAERLPVDCNVRYWEVWTAAQTQRSMTVLIDGAATLAKLDGLVGGLTRKAYWILWVGAIAISLSQHPSAERA